VYQLQERIGVQLQQAQLAEAHKVWERWTCGRRSIERVRGCADCWSNWAYGKAQRLFMNLSGGQKQRLFIALALIKSGVVFLDELTTGLDPQSRHAIWALCAGFRARQDRVFDDHLMEEAGALRSCSDHGTWTHYRH